MLLLLKLLFERSAFANLSENVHFDNTVVSPLSAQVKEYYTFFIFLMN